MHYQSFNFWKVTKLLEINKLLTQSLKLEDVLKNVITAASELISISDTLIIYLYDEKEEKLRLAEGKGIQKERLKNVAFSKGESIAGKVFKDKQSKLFKSENEIDYYMSNMSEENYRHYFEGVHNRKIKSTFSVPIINNNKCLGVLVVNNFKKDGIFTSSDMQVIEVVADQSAIAIDNSQVYHHLKEKNDLLSQSTFMHKQFYQLMIEGGGIEKILHLLGDIIGSSVSYNPDIYNEQFNDVFPIVRGNEVLGNIELTKPFDTYKPMEQIAIEHASLSIALELIKANALFEKEMHFRGEAFHQLMHGKSKLNLDDVLKFMHWEKDSRLQCIIIEGSEEPLWVEGKLVDKENFVHTVEEVTNSICGQCFIFTHTFQLIIVIPKNYENIAYKVVKTIKKRWDAKKNMLFGIGRESYNKEISSSYNEAIRSIEYAKSNYIEIVEYAKLGFERLLHELDEETINIFIQDKLNGLFSLDKSYLETLEAFIKNDKKQKETARFLHIHVNTLYYRLKKIEKILNVDLNNEKEWLDIVIAIKLIGEDNKE